VRGFHQRIAAGRFYAVTVAVRIQFGWGGQDYVVDAQGFQEAKVLFLGTGVTVKVFGVVELGGIYEDADDNVVVFRAATLYQRCVTVMEGSHGGHEADGAAGERAPMLLPSDDGIPDLSQE
jgi:hypothetical protein